MSNYKINGVNLDDIFEFRSGRTPLANPTGYKVNGVDLNERYLSLSHPDAEQLDPLGKYFSNINDLSTIFSTKLTGSLAVTESHSNSGWSGNTKTLNIRVLFASEEARNKTFSSGGTIVIRQSAGVDWDSSGESTAIKNLWSDISSTVFKNNRTYDNFNTSNPAEEVNTGGIKYTTMTSSFLMVTNRSGDLGSNLTINGRKDTSSSIEFNVINTKGSSTFRPGVTNYQIYVYYSPLYPSPSIVIS